MNDFIEYCLNHRIPNSTTKNLFSTNNPIVPHVHHVPNAEESQGQNTFPSVLGLELPPLNPSYWSQLPTGWLQGANGTRTSSSGTSRPTRCLQRQTRTYINMRASLLHTHMNAPFIGPEWPDVLKFMHLLCLLRVESHAGFSVNTVHIH